MPRGNAEMQRRCQEVIDACWAREDNPIVSIHDVGAGGLSNAIPEILNDAHVGGRIDLDRIPVADPSLTPMQVWCNESQERYVLALRPADVEAFAALCRRERCPFAVVGEATADANLIVTRSNDFAAVHAAPNPGSPSRAADPTAADLRSRVPGSAQVNALDSATRTGSRVPRPGSRQPAHSSRERIIDIPLDVLFGKPPRMHRQTTRKPERIDLVPDCSGIDIYEALARVLRMPVVGSKSFLVTIGDRSVGGLCSRDPMVGPWQVPVADCAVTLVDFDGYAGEAVAMAERAPVALLSSDAAARLTVGETVTNLTAAPIAALSDIRLSANWMAAVNHDGEGAALFDAVKAVGMALCPALGISIPVGKDSLSMETVWDDAELGAQRTVAPVSLVTTGFVRVDDVRGALTPQLRLDGGESELWLLDLGAGRNRLGGSALTQAFNRSGGVPPTLEDADLLKHFFACIQEARAAGLIRAYHDRSDGGAIVTLLEMAFAGHCGLELQLEGWGEASLRALFSEELGAVVQVAVADRDAFVARLDAHGLAHVAHTVGRPRGKLGIKLYLGAELFAKWRWQDVFRAWSETSHAMQRLRDNPASADAELAWRVDDNDPGISPSLTFDPAGDIAAPWIVRGVRPRVAILREQGVNGQVEMAAAFTRAGFDALDVHMSDLAAGRARLADFTGFAAGGGFSYGDVLGAGRGWATAILYNDALRAQFERFFADASRFALGICNGCQMLSQLKDIIPGAAHWPQFLRNESEQYEARLATVSVIDSPSILLRGMAGSRIPVVVAHGEGRAWFDDKHSPARSNACLRYVDNRGRPTETFPLNPNGSPGGLTGFTAADGRVTVMMPHPERVFRSVQMSWHPDAWGEDSPWMRMFRNARAWLA